jgi:hypothetical protein
MASQRVLAFDGLMRTFAPVLKGNGFRRNGRKFSREKPGVSQNLRFSIFSLEEVAGVDKYLEVNCDLGAKAINLAVHFDQYPVGWPYVHPSGIYEPFGAAEIASAAEFHMDWLNNFFFPLAERLFEPEEIEAQRDGVRDGYYLLRYEKWEGS